MKMRINIQGKKGKTKFRKKPHEKR